MDSNTEKLLTVGAIGVAVLFVGKSLINSFTGGSSAAAALQASAPASNPFSPLFQPYLDNYYNGGASTLCTQYGGATGLKSIYNATNGQLNGTQSDLMVYAEQLYSAMGVLTDDVSAIMAALSSLQDQCEVAYIADYLNCVYQVDLLNYFTIGKWEITAYFTTGLSSTNLTLVLNKVNALPEFVSVLPAVPANLLPASAAALSANSTVQTALSTPSWWENLLQTWGQ